MKTSISKTKIKSSDKPKDKPTDTILLIGKTKSGKTYHSTQLLENKLEFIAIQNRFLMSPTTNPVIDDTLIDYFYPEFVNKNFDEMEEFIEGILEVIYEDRVEKYEKHYYKYEEDESGILQKVKRKNVKTKPEYDHFLLYLDDCISKLRDKCLESLATYSRHYNLNIIINSQDFRKIGNVIRSNASILRFFSCNTLDLDKVCEECNEFEKKNDFKKYFKYITKEPYSYFTVNNNYRNIHVYDDNEITALEFNEKLKKGEIKLKEYI